MLSESTTKPMAVPPPPKAREGRESAGLLASVGRRLRSWIGPTIVFIALLVIWQLVVRGLDVKSYLAPAPTDVFDAFKEDGTELRENAWVTLKEMVFGFGIALVAGVAIALLLHLSRTIRQAVFPLLVGSQAVPVVVIAPILVVIFGFGLMPKLVIIALICFFPIVVTTIDGLESADSEAKNLMMTLNGSRWDTLRRVDIPGALPMFFSGTRIAATYAGIGAVFGEWAGASAGLGFMIQQQTATLNTAAMFAAVVVLCVMSLALIGLVSLVERLAAPWAPRFRGKT
jgi:putative hydroxymethylpyrimidine transport system permease protein